MNSTQFRQFRMISLIFLLISCRTLNNSPNAQVSNADSGSAQFAADITSQRSCTAEDGFLDTGELPTRVYHWTTDPNALLDPKSHMERIVRAAIPANNAGDWPGWMGNGLYVSSDPLASPEYGFILVEFDIKPHLKLPITNRNQGQDIFKKNCPGAVYGFHQSIKGSFVNDSFDGRALVLWDLGLIEISSVKTYKMQAVSRTENPARDRALSNFSTHQEKYLEKMLGIKAAVRDQTIEGWAFDDFRSLILRQKLEVCAQLPFSSKTAYFLADSTQGQMVDIANNINSSYELPPELLKSALTCLSQLKIGVNTPQNTRSIAKATATLLPNEAELKSWIMQESEFWKAAVAFSKKAQTLDDWAGEIL